MVADTIDWEFTPKMAEERPPSQVKEFYKGQTVLLTGATGYIGMCVLEKLLWSCDVKKVYTLVRPKKQMTIEQRLKKYFQHSLFDRLRKRDPNFQSKIDVLQGDLLLPNVGLSEGSRQKIIKDTTIIIHNGALVYFNLRISTLLKSNVIATQDILELAKECPNLIAFVYVSTAYSQTPRLFTEERCYPPPADLKMVQDIIEADSANEEGISSAALEQLKNQCENNYTFSKAIAEGVVEQYSRKVPFLCAIFRPTIVTWADRHPEAGWVASTNGPMHQYLAYGLGILRVIPIRDDPVLDLVPVDMTCNALLNTIWDLATFKQAAGKCYVYHFSSSHLNPMTVKSHEGNIIRYTMERPTIKMVWYPGVIHTEDMTTFFILHYIVHFIPCVFVDLYRLIIRKKPLAVSGFRKVTKNIHAVMKFQNTTFLHEMKEFPKIWERQNETDKEIFFCDIRRINWLNYCYSGWDGLRKYCLKESDDTIPAARRKLFVLKILHYTTFTLILLLFIYSMYRLACCIFGV